VNFGPVFLVGPTGFAVVKHKFIQKTGSYVNTRMVFDFFFADIANGFKRHKYWSRKESSKHILAELEKQTR